MDYILISSKVFTNCLSLHVFRAGIERNNSDGINVAKARCMLFYGLNMTICMETLFRDSVLLTKFPPFLLNFLKTMSPTVYFGNNAKERVEIMCWKFK